MVLFVHIVFDDGIKIDSQKIEVVKNCPRPTMPTKFCSFIGVVGYYIMFNDGLCSIYAMLTELTHNQQRFNQMIRVKDAFKR